MAQFLSKPMNPYDIHFWTRMVPSAIEASKWLDITVYVLGLGVAAWAFRRCRKCGYLVIAIYFTLLLFLILVIAPINRSIQSHRKPSLSEETMKKMDEAMTQAREKVLEDAGHPPLVIRQTLHLPYLPGLLVFGLWLLARLETKQPPETGKLG